MVVRPSKGGAFGHVARLGRALAERGHEVAVAGPHRAHRDELGLEVLEVEMGRAVSPGNDLRAVREMARAYRDWRPDLIHAHGSKGGVIARLARARRPGSPLVLTPHNYAFTNWFTSRSERSAYRAIETGLAPLASRALCVCEAEARIARRVGPRGRVRTVHNGIDPTPPAPAPQPAELAEFAGEAPLLAAVTEFSPPKGVPTLLEAMAEITAAIPEARLAIAGDGPLRGEVSSLVARLDLGESVRLFGQVPWVPALLERADVLLAPGWSESFPYAILEAMRAEVAIVATDVGGVGEAIEDGRSGRLVPARDAMALAAAAAELLRDPDAAALLAAAAAERQRARFTLAGMVEGTLAVYRELGVG
jgi:glycosyltransferase involved in cell wall biosynthesis